MLENILRGNQGFSFRQTRTSSFHLHLFSFPKALRFANADFHRKKIEIFLILIFYKH